MESVADEPGVVRCVAAFRCAPFRPERTSPGERSSIGAESGHRGCVDHVNRRQPVRTRPSAKGYGNRGRGPPATSARLAGLPCRPDRPGCLRIRSPRRVSSWFPTAPLRYQADARLPIHNVFGPPIAPTCRGWRARAPARPGSNCLAPGNPRVSDPRGRLPGLRRIDRHGEARGLRAPPAGSFPANDQRGFALRTTSKTSRFGSASCAFATRRTRISIRPSTGW